MENETPPPTQWIMLGLELRRVCPDTRYGSNTHFEDSVELITGETEQEVLGKAAERDAKVDPAAWESRGEGPVMQWLGPFCVVPTDVYYGGEPELDTSRADPETVRKRVESVPDYARHRQTRAAILAASIRAEQARRARIADAAERAQYQRLKQKYGDSQ